MKKKGQFYLVAAMIIVIVLVSFITISNYAQKRNTSEFGELQTEIEIEIENVLDYVVKNDLSKSSRDVILENLSSIYIDKIGTAANVIFLYGEQDAISLKGYNYGTNISIDVGGGFVNVSENIGEFTKTYSPTVTETSIKVDFDIYLFNLEEGQNFYFLISKEEGDEKEVIIGWEV